MALEGCAACLKYLMIVWNFLILILGVAILGVGVWMVVDQDSGEFVDDVVQDGSPFIINYSRVSDPGLYEALAYVLIVLGAVILIIAFLGCCGALRESQCMLGTCFILLFLIFGALVGAGIYLYVERDEINVNKEKLEPLIEEIMLDAVAKYDTDQESRDFMDAVQQKYDCCGAVFGPKEYGVSTATICSVAYVDQGCARPYAEDIASKIGVSQFFSGKMTIAMAVALGTAGGLIMAMILTLCLCCSIRRSGSY